MKKIIQICIASALMVTFGTAEDFKRGQVLSKEGNYVSISPMTGARVFPDGTDKGIDLRPQGVEHYYDTQLAKGVSFQTGIVDTLQKDLAIDIDVERMELRAKETFVGVMNNRTGELLMLTRTSKFDPINIKTKEIPVLKDRFADFLFEPDKLLLPLMGTLFSGDKSFKKKMKHLTKETFVHTLASFKTPQELHTTFSSLGFLAPSGVDLPHDVSGSMLSLDVLKDEEKRARMFLGRGLKVSFMQMLKAYSIFSANGYILTPHIATATVENNRTKKLHFLKTKVIAKDAASSLKLAHIRSTRTKPGLVAREHIDIGGMFARVSIDSNNTKSQAEAYSAFFGFVEDLFGRSYTIGILTVHPDDQKDYSPKKMLNTLVDRLIEEKLLYVKKDYLTVEAMSPMPEGEIVEHYDTYLHKCPEEKEGKKGMRLDCAYLTYKAPEDGVFIHTVLDGKVIFVGKTQNDGKSVVIVRHKDNLDSVYMNLDYATSTLKIGQEVKKGYSIGRVTDTLKFQVLKNGVHVDPLEHMEL